MGGCLGWPHSRWTRLGRRAPILGQVEVRRDRGERVASRVETGMMFVDNIDWPDAELPFGGIKNSGYGRELGDMGIQEFVNKKLVRVASMEAPA
jgi:acyl-CoA reductase-like NAD-dependent aldehyde dehydrogenase